MLGAHASGPCNHILGQMSTTVILDLTVYQNNMVNLTFSQYKHIYNINITVAAGPV